MTNKTTSVIFQLFGWTEMIIGTAMIWGPPGPLIISGAACIIGGWTMWNPWKDGGKDGV